MLAAFLDACVLYPTDYRDLLLRLAQAGAFRPLWSPEVQREWMQNLLLRRTDLTKEQLEYTRQQMNRAFPHACVNGYEHIVGEVYGLPDQNDRHVVAAAHIGGAEYIVTENIKDFPSEALERFELEALRLEAFLMLLVELDILTNGVPITTGKALAALRRGLRNPRKTQEELISHWHERGLHDFAKFALEYRKIW